MTRKIILEQDAKNSFCPATNNFCVGASCMMWTWSTEDPEIERRKKDHRATTNEANLNKKFTPIKGCCGL